MQGNIRAFMARVQKTTEGVAEFAFSLLTLAKRAFPKTDEATKNSMLLNQLLNGLKSDVRLHPYMLGVATFDEALRRARLIEEDSMGKRLVNAIDMRPRSPIDIRYFDGGESQRDTRRVDAYGEKQNGSGR